MTFIVQNVGLLEQIITVFSDAKEYIWAKIYSIYFSDIFYKKKRKRKKKAFQQQIQWMTLQALRKMGEDYGKYFSKNFSFFLFQKVEEEDREENLI